MPLRTVFSLVLIASWLSQAQAQELSPSAIFETAAPSIVVVKGLDRDGNPIMLGSGVVISPGRIVTNCHVVSTADSAIVISHGKTFSATLQFADPERDLCSFQVPSLPAPSAHMGASAGLKVGARIYAIGAPRGFNLTLSDGLLSSLRAIDGGSILQVTAPISPGSSGGGLFDGQGRLVGITTMYLADSQQINFAVPVEWIGQLAARSDVQALARASEDQEIARTKQQLVDFDTYMTSNDPTYATKRTELDRAVREIRKRLPPDQWLEATGRAYAAIPDPSPLAIPDGGTTERTTRPHDGDGRWISIASDPWVQIDRTSVRREGMLVTAWSRTSYAAPIAAGPLRGVKSVLASETFDCTRRASWILEAIHYDTAGRVLASDRYAASETYHSVAPDSVEELKLATLCQ